MTVIVLMGFAQSVGQALIIRAGVLENSSLIVPLGLFVPIDFVMPSRVFFVFQLKH